MCWLLVLALCPPQSLELCIKTFCFVFVDMGTRLPPWMSSRNDHTNLASDAATAREKSANHDRQMWTALLQVMGCNLILRLVV